MVERSAVVVYSLCVVRYGWWRTFERERCNGWSPDVVLKGFWSYGCGPVRVFMTMFVVQLS